MIYFYKHRGLNELSQTEFDMLGFEGVAKFARERGLDPNEVFAQIKTLEADIDRMNLPQFDVSSGALRETLDSWVNRYVEYFNNCARHDRQAYVILGNIATGKSTYSKKIEEETGSIIIDADRYKMGEETDHGFFVGLSGLYQVPTDRERMQEACSFASKQTIELASRDGLNMIIPKSTTTVEKLEKHLQVLVDRNYDVHLIMFESPIKDCADRSYFRYLIREYAEAEQGANKQHGRFVPVSVITDIGDSTFTTFAKAYKKGRYTSYKAFYNEGLTKHESKYANEEIDLETMQVENI